MLSLTGFVFAALVAIPVFFTGEPAEQSVEGIAGISELTIENHEEAAELTIWLIELTGIAALAGLIIKSKELLSSGIYIALMILFASVSAISISYTGYLGGQIRHTELNASAPVSTDFQNIQSKGDDD